MTWDFVQLTKNNRSDIMSVLSSIQSLSWLGLSIHNWVVTPSHHFGAQWPLAFQRSTSLLLRSVCFVWFLSYITASSNVSVEPTQDKKHLYVFFLFFFCPFLALTILYLWFNTSYCLVMLLSILFFTFVLKHCFTYHLFKAFTRLVLST